MKILGTIPLKCSFPVFSRLSVFLAHGREQLPADVLLSAAGGRGGDRGGGGAAGESVGPRAPQHQVLHLLPALVHHHRRIEV